MNKLTHSSVSEDNGIAILASDDKRIYSVGISTGGLAEMRMAISDPERHIIATTIDSDGASFAQNKIDIAGLSTQIKVKLEDVASSLPYSDGYFDYIYARLVLHYLDKQKLQFALSELYRILKVNGRIFVVVRSVECNEAQDQNATFDLNTGFTTYTANGKIYSRYFHTKESISKYLLSSGFSINNIRSYQEQLCFDFQRTIPSQVDTLIEVLAIKH